MKLGEFDVTLTPMSISFSLSYPFIYPLSIYFSKFFFSFVILYLTFIFNLKEESLGAGCLYKWSDHSLPAIGFDILMDPITQRYKYIK